MKINVNSIYEPVTEDSVLSGLARILFVDDRRDLVVVIQLAEPLLQPVGIDLSAFRESLILGEIKLATVTTPEFLLVLEEDLSEKKKKDRDDKWSIIEPLIQSTYPGQIFSPGEIGRLVGDRARELGIERKAIYRILYRFWAYGQVRNSLLKNYANVGVSERVSSPEKPPGRRPKFQGITLESRKILGVVDKRCIRVGYSLFVDDDKPTKTSAYTEMLRRFYTEKTITKSPEAEARLLPDSVIPSFRQFEYWGKKYFDQVKTDQGRMGLKWLKDFRPISGTVRDGLRGPCHQFEIDATVADIYLVNSYSKRMLIGRPVVYIVVDSFSGMIVGLYVGLEGPSWNGARQALFNAFTSKVQFCELNGVIISSDAWPCHHLPHNIYADRGEMLGKAAEGLSSGLKIELGIAPPYRPDWKSMVESRFGILNDLTGIRWLPGGVAAREKERGERDYRLDATLNLKEFTKVIIECVLHYNRFNRQPERLTQEMMNDGVEPTPICIWSWALENGHIDPNDRPDELVYLHLLPREKATVQKGGLYFRGMYYVCDEAINNNWFALARRRGVWSVECWYDPNSSSHIWIQGDDKQFIRCHLRQSDRKYADYRSDEIFDLLEAYRQVPPGHKRAELESRVSLHETMNQVVSSALAEREDEPAPATKAEVTANIRENRAEEKLKERKNAPVPRGVRAPSGGSTNAPTEQSESHIGARSAQVIDMLKRLRPGQNS